MGRTNALRLWLALSCVLVSTVLAGGALEGAEPGKRDARAPEAELRLVRRVRLGSATVYRYRQYVDGYEVLGAEAVVNATDGVAPKVISDATRDDVAKPPRHGRDPRSRHRHRDGRG